MNQGAGDSFACPLFARYGQQLGAESPLCARQQEALAEGKGVHTV